MTAGASRAGPHPAARRLGPALLAATMMGCFAAPATAASASYCGGALIAESFYRTFVRGEGWPRIEYRGRFRFVAPGPSDRILVARLVPLARIQGLPVTRPAASFDLAWDEARDIAILSLRTNRDGTGAPNAHTVGGQAEFTCSYRPAG